VKLWQKSGVALMRLENMAITDSLTSHPCHPSAPKGCGTLITAFEGPNVKQLCWSIAAIL